MSAPIPARRVAGARSRSLWAPAAVAWVSPVIYCDLWIIENGFIGGESQFIIRRDSCPNPCSTDAIDVTRDGVNFTVHSPCEIATSQYPVASAVEQIRISIGEERRRG